MVRELGGGWRAQLAAAVGWALMPVALGSASIFHPTWFDQLAWAAFLYVALRVLGRPEPRLWPRARPGRRDRPRGQVHDRGAPGRVHDRDARDAVAAACSRRAGRGSRSASRCSSSSRTSSGRRSTAGRASTSPRARTRRLPRTPRAAAYLVQGVALPRPRRRGDRGRRNRLALAAAAAAAARDRAGRGDVDLPRRARAELLPAARRHHRVRGGDRLAWRLAARREPGALGGRRRARRSSSSRCSPWRRRSCCRCARPPRWCVPGPGRTRSTRTSSAGRSSRIRRRRPGAGCRPRSGATASILAANYGEASALEHYGPARGLPLVLSGHLSWQYWRPRRLDQRFALVVGYDRGFLGEICSSWRTLAHIDNRWHIANEERGRTIDACTLKRPARRALAPVSSPATSCTAPATCRGRSGRGRRRRCAPTGRGCRAARGGRSPSGERRVDDQVVADAARGRASSAAAAAARRSTRPAGCTRSGTARGTCVMLARVAAERLGQPAVEELGRVEDARRRSARPPP